MNINYELTPCIANVITIFNYELCYSSGFLYFIWPSNEEHRLIKSVHINITVMTAASWLINFYSYPSVVAKASVSSRFASNAPL